MSGTDHDCVKDRCDDDTRTAEQVEAEGREAGLRGESYYDCPYGGAHPDLRFNAWQRGRWKVLGLWCYAHNQWHDFCWGDALLSIPPEATPCDLSERTEPAERAS